MIHEDEVNLEICLEISVSVVVILSGLSKSNEPWRIPVSEISAGFNQNSELPDWVEECIIHGRIPSTKEWKFSFHLLPADVS